MNVSFAVVSPSLEIVALATSERTAVAFSGYSDSVYPIWYDKKHHRRPTIGDMAVIYIDVSTRYVMGGE